MQALAFQTASPEPGHVCFGSGFINEDKPIRFQPVLPITPVMALAHDIGALPFRRVRCFFLKL